MESALKENTASSLRVDHMFSERATVSPGRSGTLASAWYVLTHWETWDWRIKYLIITPAWIWFCLRARSWWFFTAANPSLTFGGFEGESKWEMYRQLPPGSFPRSILVPSGIPANEALARFRQNNYNFPVAVKPDVGKMGLMFRRINTESELLAYHGKLQRPYILQELVNYPIEVSVFYYRHPGSERGTITGFIRKEFLEVVGNGRDTLRALIDQYARVRFRREEMYAKHRDRLRDVLAEGERFCLCPALNLSRGGKLVSLEIEKDDRLLAVFDRVSQYTKTFHYGRFDIKCQSVDDLKEGKNFSILEYNGSGAEPHHVYGNGYNLVQACAILVFHWKILCDISRANMGRGIPCWKFRKGWRFLKASSRHIGILKTLDAETPVT